MIELLDDDLLELDEPVAEGATVGIDLGTTNSVVAAIVDGRARVFTDPDGARLHPSVVAFMPNGERLVGARAKRRRLIDPENTIFSAKRIIGQPIDSVDVQSVLAGLPYKVIEGENKEPLIETRAGPFRVPEVSGFVVGHLLEIATRSLDEPISQGVITVPANFSEGQREATRRAAAIAGMHTLRVLNEPTAAALAYGHQRELGERIAVFDFGGGTFDVTVLVVRENLYEVVATGGDPYLGGDDMDIALANRLARDFLEAARINVNDDPRARARLLTGAESIKVKLTTDDIVEGKITDMAYGVGGFSIPLEFHMDRARFESIIEPIVARTIDKTESVLRTAGIAPELVNEVILVGGSTKVPLVQERVAAYFGKEPRVTIDPMEVVAIGAALHGNSLYGSQDADGPAVGVLMDVTSHSLGVQTAGGYVERLIPKNTTIPTEKTRVFSTSKDYQEVVDLKICQGESKRYEDNIPVGELRLTGLRSAHRGQVKLEVTFLVDEDGLIQVSAKDPESGAAAQAVLRVTGVGDKEQLAGQ